MRSSILYQAVFLGLMGSGLVRLGALGSSPLLAQDACATLMQSQCQAAQEDTACMETLYACGAYEQLLGRFTGRLQALSLAEQYFAGVSYLGLADRQRAKSVKCAYTDYGKTALVSFLSQAQASSAHYGQFGDSRLTRYVYHASKSLQLAKSVEGCQADGHTQASINAYAQRYTEESLKALFIGGAAADPHLKQSLDELMQRMQDFVNAASGVETRLALSGLEIDFAQQQLDAMKSGWEQSIGPVHSGAAHGPVFDQSIFKRTSDWMGARGLSSSPIGKVYAKEDEFHAIFQDCQSRQTEGESALSCADIYAQRKAGTIKSAKDLMAKATLLGALAQSKLGPANPALGAFIGIRNESSHAMPLSVTENRIFSLWRQYGERNNFCNAASKPWYCKNHAARGAKP